MIYIKKDWIAEWLCQREDDAKNDNVIKVVQCKDCDNWCGELKHGYARLGTEAAPCAEWSDQEDGHTRFTKPTDFCSRAEPKEGAE